MKKKQTTGSSHHQVVIFGAGFSGINMAIQLRDSGIDDFVILERAPEAGGTWRDNTYPGCACDVPSILYSYSFEQNPDWSSAFAGFREIQAYINRCIDKYGIRPHLKAGVEVRQAHFEKETAQWRLQDESGHVYHARAVICATGGLVNPVEPDIPGRDSFKGRILHTAQWDKSLELRNKRVAVIGTGASAIQVIPAIQKDVSALTVFQRTAPWVLPKPEVLATWLGPRFSHKPLLRNFARRFVFAGTEALLGPVTTMDTPLSSVLEFYGKRYLQKNIKDARLRQKLTPDFRIGCKRILLSNDYYPALAQANVEVIQSDIQAFDSTGIITAGGQHHAVDIIIMATGFRSDIGRAPFTIVGPEGNSLEQVWQQPSRSKAYKGVAVSGFPNWFIMLGPNTGPGHTSVLVYTEAQSRYILAAIKPLVRGSLRTLSVKNHIQASYGEKLQSRMKKTSWSTGCTSWYVDKNGENHATFPGLASEYVLSMRNFKLNEYTTT